MAGPSGVAAWAEAALALTGTLRLALGDRGALACFNATEEGFWRSFRAAVLCYPMFVLLLVFPVEIGTADEGHSWSYFIVETIRFVIAWTAFPLIALPLASWLGRGDRFLLFMTVYNWCQVPQTVAFTAVTMLGALGALPPEGVLLGDLVVGIGSLVYEWYVSRVALAISGPQAGLVILIDVVLATLLSHIATTLY
jgi:hypothetical protein